MLVETCSSDSCKFKCFPTDMLTVASSPKRTLRCKVVSEKCRLKPERRRPLIDPTLWQKFVTDVCLAIC